ncbi:MAG: site-specific integrase [Micavibrio aeruginosavorus]|nr:site-specific integrase [Micavibrio aeruginosavorus]
MSDIRKRVGKNGTTYQVRYADRASKTGYAYKTFDTARAARAFREDAAARAQASSVSASSMSVEQAVKEWLDICEKEGLNGRDPVTAYTLENYEYRASFIKGYAWTKELRELTAPDIAEFRSWLLRSDMSRDLAGKVLSSFQSMMKEMTVRGRIPINCAAGISVRSDSRYDEPVTIPTKSEIKALLKAADDLSNAKNQTVAKPWQRYRPMLYLAVDSGMRPQEYLAVARSSLGESGIKVERAIEGDGSRISVTKTPTGRRFIDLTDTTINMVRHYAENIAAPNDHDLIFPDKSGRWQCRRNWQRRGFDVACEKAGLMVEQDAGGGEKIAVPKFRPYDLRHFFASYHIDKGTNLKKLQKMMGHKDIETTLNVYGHLLDDDEKRADGVLSCLV